jgi:pimeloyl-ACP methyl ester carboxylesterase
MKGVSHMLRSQKLQRALIHSLSAFCLFALTVLIAVPAVANNSKTSTEAGSPAFERRVIQIDDATSIYTLVHRGQRSKGTFVLLNGLVYDITRWDPVATRLAASGYTVVRYAYSGQPENLRLLKKGEEPPFFRSGLDMKDLAGELELVLKNLGIRERVYLVGLSYGASVAAEFASRNPEKVEETILMSPLVIPLDYYDPSGNALRVWLNTVRFWENAPCDFYGAINPWLCASRDYWYDSFYNFIYQNYLTERVQNIPEGIDKATHKKAVFHLVRATRDFDLRSYAPGLANVHMLVATDDQPELKRDQERAWSEVRSSEKRSFVVFKGAAHALPDVSPLRTYEVLDAIAKKNPEFYRGKKLEVRGDR